MVTHFLNWVGEMILFLRVHHHCASVYCAWSGLYVVSEWNLRKTKGNETLLPLGCYWLQKECSAPWCNQTKLLKAKINWIQLRSLQAWSAEGLLRLFGRKEQRIFTRGVGIRQRRERSSLLPRLWPLGVCPYYCLPFCPFSTFLSLYICRCL